jgi:hypothetical protein
MVMQKFFKLALCAAAAAMIPQGCALIFRGARQKVIMQSLTGGVQIYVDGNWEGTDYVSKRLRRSTSHSIIFKKEGCSPQNVHIGSELSGGWVAWDVINILWLNPIPILCDGISGAWRYLDKTQVAVDLDCSKSSASREIIREVVKEVSP